MKNTITPTTNNATTRNLLVHFITSGPPIAISVPKTTHNTPNIGFHKSSFNTIPKFFIRLIIEEENKLAATAYHPKFAKLITIDNIATPLFPNTALNHIHKSIPYLTAKKIGKQLTNTQIKLKAKILINICLNPKNCATYAPCV